MPAQQEEKENVFEVGLDTWFVATGQVPASVEEDGLIRAMAVVLLGEEWLEPEMAQRLLPIGPWASRDEALRDGQARARLRDLTSAEKDGLRRALFGARKCLARYEGQEAEQQDPREWLYQAALENVTSHLTSKGWEVEVTEDQTEDRSTAAVERWLGQLGWGTSPEPLMGFRAIVEAAHPRKPGPILRFIVSARHVAKSGNGFSAAPGIEGGCVSCVRTQGCEQICPFYGRSFCHLHVFGIGRQDDREYARHTLGLGKVDF